MLLDGKEPDVWREQDMKTLTCRNCEMVMTEPMPRDEESRKVEPG